MQPDPIAIIKGVKLLAAISLLCVNYLAILPYFHKPEEFFIKSLRPESDSQFTHNQLLFRAFVGVGFISTGVWALAFTLAFSVVSDIAWWMWPAITLGGGTIVGAAEYAYFRLVRYRRMRRQYKPILNQDEEAGRGGYLSYIGPSNLSRREKTTIAIIAAAALVACLAVPLLWILCRSQA